MIPVSTIASFADTSLKAAEPKAQSTETVYKYEKVDKIDSTTANYLIVYQNGNTSVALNNKGNSTDNDTSVSITSRSDGDYDITNVDDSVLWNFSNTVTSSTSNVNITNKASNQQLEVNNGSISMNNYGDDLVIVKDGEYFKIYYDRWNSNNDNYLKYENTAFTGYRTYASSDASYKMTIYKQVGETINVTYTFTEPTKKVYRIGQAIKLAGGKITATYEDGTTKEISLNDSNVEISGFNTSTVGEKAITVKYKGQTFNYSINVVESSTTPIDPSIEDDADYPGQGSVRITKDVTNETKESFENTGLARLELAVTGVPSKKGVDAVLVFDRSLSMNTTVSGTSKTRAQVAKEASIEFIEKVLEDNADGSFSNNRIAIVTFNDEASQLVALSNNETTLKNAINSLTNKVNSGNTNYDAGVKAAYNILNNAKNQEGYNREQAVLFLSDGAPQNGYNDCNVKSDKSSWVNSWEYGDATYNQLSNKGAMKEHKYSTNVKNLPATMYTVGFGLADYQGFSKAQTETILRDWMATSVDTFYSVQSAEELSDAFVKIGTSIKKAGTEAKVTDKMGSEFNLQMGQQYPSGVTQVSFPADFDTTIKVLSYKLDSEGNRTNKVTNLETVTFSQDGKTATSDQKSDQNIIVDNKIQAKYFTYDLTTETFVWNIGDITEEEVVLSYPVYLEGSMEGTRAAGNYYTNESAILEYKNINDKNWHKDFYKPQLPWKSANVHIEYYLVNKDGQPINTAGKVIPYAYRVTVSEETKPLSKGQLVDIKAKDNVPAGYTLHNKDAFYKITNVGQNGATREYSNDDKSTVVSNTNSPYTTSSVAFGVMTTTDLAPDSIVLDYGKPVTFNVLKNDGLKNITLNGVAKQEGTTIGVDLNTALTYTHNDKFIGSDTGEYGTVEVKDQKGDVTYTLSKYIDGIDKFYYEVKGKTTNEEGKDVDFYKYSSINVIPATSVYYEDNFSSGTNNEDGTTNGIVFNGNNVWTTVTDENYSTEGKEEQDSEQGPNTTYGQDSSYANDNTFSYGSAHVVTAQKGAPASAKFTFKGTGFEIISRTDNSTGMMTVKVYNSENKLVKNIPCNTVYETTDGVLYQIPVISVDGLEYGQYKVIITVTGTTDQDGVDHSSTVYIDGVRIYNPIDPNSTDATEANNKYIEDKEANEVVYEIRNLLLDKNSLTSGTDANGIVYVDSKGNTSTIADYENLGPNNEVYLKKGNSIGFKLKSSQPAAIKVGLKTPEGVASKVTIGSNKDSSKEIELSSATSMYYDVTDSIVFDQNNEAYVVITNTGNTDTIVSLTKIKFTFETTPVITPSIVSNEESANYAVRMTLSRNAVESTDENTGNEDEDNTSSEDQGSSDNKDNEQQTNIVNALKNFINSIRDMFRK